MTVDLLLDALWPGDVPEAARQALHSTRVPAAGSARPGRWPAADLAGRLPAGSRRGRTRRRAGAGAAGGGPRGTRLASDRCGTRSRSGGARCSPTSSTSRRSRWRSRVAPGCSGRSRTRWSRRRLRPDGPRRCRARGGVGGRGPAARTGRAGADAGAGGGRAGARSVAGGREYRRRLADEAGLDPSPALAELEREVAGGVAGPPRRGPRCRPDRRRAWWDGPRRSPRCTGRSPRDGWSAWWDRAGSARPGSRWRWPRSPGPWRCCCSRRSPNRGRSGTRSPRR